MYYLETLIPNSNLPDATGTKWVRSEIRKTRTLQIGGSYKPRYVNFLDKDQTGEVHTLRWYLNRLKNHVQFRNHPYRLQNSRLVHTKTGEKIPVAILL